MTTDSATDAARVLIAYWRREELDADTRVLCGRLAAAVDASGLLAAGVRANPDTGLIRLAEVIRRGARNRPVIAELVGELLAVTPARPRRARRGRGAHVNQKVDVRGSGNVTTVTGRDLLIGTREPSRRGEPATPASHQDAILVTSASPVDLDPLRLGEEEREIRETLDLSSGRERWIVHTRSALRLRDLSRALQQLRPRILHFCGHATKSGVILEDAIGQSRELPSDALADLFAAIDHDVECVVLNACYGKATANMLAEHVPFVVGSANAVPDEAAIAFSVGFYQGVGEYGDIRKACQIGRVYMRDAGTPSDLLPTLIERS
jgi:CHAT domain-containing protein